MYGLVKFALGAAFNNPENTGLLLCAGAALAFVSYLT